MGKFLNLQSKFRGKKEFYFYDKIVPEPLTPFLSGYSYSFKIDTEKVLTGDTQYKIPLFTTTDGLINVDWGDGIINPDVSTEITHTYANPGVYTIRLFPNANQYIKSITHNSTSNSALNNTKKVIEFIDWGNNVSNWDTMARHFRYCENISGFTSESPVLVNVSDMSFMFEDMILFNEDISSWDVSNVTNMRFLFNDATSFNQDISSWDVSNVTNISWVFSNASSFNQPLNSWNVSGVTTLFHTFFGATSFNQPLSSWTVSNVTNMSETFAYATSFNQDISSWNTSNLRDMPSMFYSATSFNQDISSWDTSNVENMVNTFKYATSFDQDLASWNISSLIAANFMFDNSGLSTTNYDNLLIGWAAQAPNINSNVTLGAAGINRTSASASAYNTLTTTYNWTINDAGQI
jgi:surface protein